MSESLGAYNDGQQAVGGRAGDRLSGQDQRSNGAVNRNARKTHCPQGHPYSGDNLYVDPNGNRRCQQCRRDRRAKALGDESLRWPRVRKPQPARGIHNRLKTHCPKGHPYLGSNLYVDPKGFRRCLECKHEARQRARDNKRPGPPKPRRPRGIHNQVKTHCPRGHPYSDSNLYVDPKGNRRCRECKRLARKGS